MELLIIRHGQSTNNALGNPWDRVADPPLTELGKRQAQILAQHLATGVRRLSSAEIVPGTADVPYRRGYVINRLYCSPMWRALQTAQFIGRELALNPEVWIDIHERGGMYLDHGGSRGIVGHTGATKGEVLAAFPNYDLPDGITERGWWDQGFEEPSSWKKRAARAADQLRQWAHSDERIAMVTHGGFMHELLIALLNPRQGDHFFHHNNVGISKVVLRSDGFLEVHYLNRLDHLPPELVS